MKPFIVMTTCPGYEAAQDEYEPFLTRSGLSRDDLQHIVLGEVDFPDSFTATSISGVLIGANPYNADTSTTKKIRSQPNVEEQVRELLGVIFKEGIPLLVTGIALQVLVVYLSAETQEEFGEELGAVGLSLTVEGREDLVLKGLPRAVAIFTGHYERVGEVPVHATLLVSSPNCPVQALCVGRNVYACQFNLELNAVQFERRVSTYDEAGYGDLDISGDILIQVRSPEVHDVGQVIRDSVPRFSRS